MKLSLDENSLTLGDVDDLETASGWALGQVIGALEGTPEGQTPDIPFRVILALIWVCSRKDDPSLTFDQVRAMPLTDLGEIEFDLGGEEVDPTNASV